MAEHILKDTHNPKLNILECDRTTPLKQNLVPRFARAGNKEERSGEEIPSRIRQEKATIMEKRREF